MLLTIVVFIVILGLLVFVHELGHFVSAKKYGAGVDEFGFGFPPRICGWKKINGRRKFFWGSGSIESEDTIYSFNWIPLGGFVKIKGEGGESKEDEDSFANKKPWKRAIILSAGVFMNLVLAAVLLMVVFGIGAPQIIEGDLGPGKLKETNIQVISVIEGSPAEEAKIQMGDFVIKVDGRNFEEIESLQTYTDGKTGQVMSFVFKRGGKEITKEVTPIILEETGNGGIGVGLVKTGIVSYPWYYAIWMGIKATVLLTGQILVAFGVLIKNLIIQHKTTVDLAGPVGIAVLTGQVARMGFVYILQFAALLSINLAIINFLPFPALDGGRILFLAIEKIRGKAINQKVENAIHTVGFTLLMLLVLLVTFRDVAKFSDTFVEIWDKVIH